MARMTHVPLMAIDPRRRGFGKLFIVIVASVVVIDAKDALDAPDDATDRAADDGADRSGAAIAFIETVRGTAGDALRVRRGGGEDCKNRTDDRNANVHEVPLC
jgi:hypothetical protein